MRTRISWWAVFLCVAVLAACSKGTESGPAPSKEPFDVKVTGTSDRPEALHLTIDIDYSEPVSTEEITAYLKKQLR